MTKIQNLNPIALIVVVLVAGVLLGYFGSGQLTFGNLSPEAAGEKSINFINQSIVQKGITASLLEVMDMDQYSLYKIHLKIEETGQEYDSYITKDGKLFFTSGINMSEVEAAQEEETEETGQEERSAEGLASFAQCLTDEGLKFYGSKSCGWCQKQKELFGDAFQYVTYVECLDSETQQWSEECKQDEITATPTWEIGGKKSSGYKTLEQLSELSGCSL